MENLQKYLDNALKKVDFADNAQVNKVVSYDIETEIAELVLMTREQLQLTQKHLSEKSGVTQANISKIETGNYCPSVAVLKKLADSMGKRLKIEFVDTEEIF